MFHADLHWRNGSLLKYADSFFSHWRQSFDSCSTYRSGRLFFYCSVGDDDYPPSSDEWHGTGNAADISAVSTDQDRIICFVAEHSRISKENLEKLMMNTSMLSKDLGTVLVGEDAVMAGLVNEVGGIDKAYQKLRGLMSY